jgi:hypothetical protein
MHYGFLVAKEAPMKAMYYKTLGLAIVLFVFLVKLPGCRALPSEKVVAEGLQLAQISPKRTPPDKFVIMKEETFIVR